MLTTNLRATGPLTSLLSLDERGGNWSIAGAAKSSTPKYGLLAGFTCDCNRHTLAQITRSDDIEIGLQLGITCHRDGRHAYRPYARTPWMVENYAILKQEWRCDRCSEVIGQVGTLDGVVVSLDVRCPICETAHAIDLAIGALPPDLRALAFQIDPPRPLVSPPAYGVLRWMWECIQKHQTNTFSYNPYTVRYDSGRLCHAASGTEFEAATDHLVQLTAADLVLDDDALSISRSGVIVCLREFGGAGV